jgi:hypothetical protein
LPINQLKAPEFSLGGIQMWTFYNQEEIFEGEKVIAGINTNDVKLDFKLIPEEDQKRAKMIIVNKNTESEFIDAKFYQNGNLVDYVYVQPMEWSSIVVSLGTSIDINSVSGQFELYSGILFNNIAFFEKLTDVYATSVISRPWSEVQSSPILGPLSWSFWTSFTWLEMQNETTIQQFSINGNEIFNSYLGLSKAVVSDDTVLTLNSERLESYVGVTWSEFVGKPV